MDIASRNILYYATGTGDTNTRAVMYLTPGVYNLEYATWEGVGGFWYQVASAKGFFLNQADTTTWRTIGYVPTPPPLSMVGDWTVQSTPASGMTQSDIPSAKIAVAAAVAANAAAATSLWPQINFFDPQSGGTGRIGGDIPWPRNTDADDNKWGMRMFGTLRIPVSGNYLIGFQGDDGTQITVGGANAGFTELLENITNGGVIGRESTVMANSGSLGAAANSNDGTDGEFSQEGALAGDANKALALDGVPPGNKVTVPYAPGMNPGASANAAAVAAPFTVEAWVKPTNTTGVQAVVNSMIAGANQNPSNGNDRSGYVLRFNGTDWQFYIGNEAIYCIILHAPGTVIADTWQHVVGLWDGTLAKLYVDGIKVAEAGVNAGSINGGPAPQSNGNPRANFAAPLYIGKRGFADWRFTGSVDEVAVYGSALAESVIISHKTNGLNAARTTPYATLVQASAPLAYYRLDETRKPRVDLNTITTDLPTGNNSTVGKIFLNAGDYPIDATFWEDGGGSYVEIFAAPDSDTPVYRALANSADYSGLVLVKPPGNTTTTVPPVLIGPGLTINANSALSISFQSVPGATYTLESSLNLGTWQAINTNILATGTTTTEVGTPGTYFFYTPAEPKRYYRIRNN